MNQKTQVFNCWANQVSSWNPSRWCNRFTPNNRLNYFEGSLVSTQQFICIVDKPAVYELGLILIFKLSFTMFTCSLSCSPRNVVTNKYLLMDQTKYIYHSLEFRFLMTNSFCTFITVFREICSIQYLLWNFIVLKQLNMGFNKYNPQVSVL
jgi:hypothetical protein